MRYGGYTFTGVALLTNTEQREWDAAQARDRERREAIQKRARELLCRSLTPAQRQSLDEHGFFDLNVGGRHYRIRQGTHGNVRLILYLEDTMYLTVSCGVVSLPPEPPSP